MHSTAAASGEISEIERRVSRKLAWRVIPVLFGLYAFFALDRGNVGFAASQLEAHLGISSAIYGLGASLFTLAYLASGVPAVLTMKRFRSAFALGAVGCSFGAVSALTAFVWNNESFLAIRLLLGVAEAGFGSFVVYYINQMFPSNLRGRAISSTLVAVPITMMIASPISGALLNVDLGQLHGWQWLFLVEGLPAVLLGLFCIAFVPSTPSAAKFLTDEERAWLVQNTARADTTTDKRDVSSTFAALKTPAVWVLAAVLFAQTLGTSIMLLWMPTMIEQASQAGAVAVGWLNAAPWVAFAAGMIALGRVADKVKSKATALVIAQLIAIAGFLLAIVSSNLTLAFAGLIIGAFGMGAMMGVFWTLPMQMLGGAGLISAFALINVLGNSSGIFSHPLIGWLHDRTGSLVSALVLLCVALAIAATLLTVFDAMSRRKAKSIAANPAAP